MNQRNPIPPGVFVLHDGMGLVAKRLEHVPMRDPPRMRIISDHDRYTPYECTSDELDIMGAYAGMTGRCNVRVLRGARSGGAE